MVHLPPAGFARRFRSVIFLPLFLLLAQALTAQIPSGYYNNATGTGAALKTNLYNIIKGHTSISYAAIWTAFLTTDDRSDGKVWDMYSDIPGGTPPYEFTFITDQCGSASAEGDCYSREHSFPKSWFGGDVAPMYTDLFHIVPTDQYVNNMRSDHPYGKVTTPTWTSLNGSKRGPCTTPGYTGTVFEPRDEFKGDFARNYFYMATRYENVIATWQNNNAEGAQVLDGTSYPCYQAWYIAMLLDWNAQDPVSQKEIDRNEAVYSIQHNRNPFIDHPEYAAAIWAPGAGPVVTTNAATIITTSSATLNGTVNPNGVATTYHFEWGATTSYGTSSTVTSAGSGSSVANVSANISSLAAGTIYHFRLVAVNSNGTTYGGDLTLTTLSPTLLVSPSDRPVTSAAGSVSYTVTSNSSWAAVSNQSWCTVTPSGSGNGTINANYSANTTISSRVTNITVTASGLTPIVVTVTQAGATPILSVNPADQPVTASSGNTSFSVTSNTSWTSSSNQSWCTVTPSGTGNGTITATYSANATIVSRVATVTVTVTGLTPVAVTVTQAAASPTLLVTPSNQAVSSSSGNTSFSVTSNTSWTASSNQSWCTPTTSGSGNGTITATYSANSTVLSRAANITVTVTGVTPMVVTVTQAGLPLPPEPTNFPTNFSGYNIHIQWTDATGTIVPTGYLVRMSNVGFDSIAIPVDGIAVPNSATDKNVPAGAQEAWFGNLLPKTTYYFKIFSYTGSGASIDYKTDAVIPQVQKSTLQ